LVRRINLEKWDTEAKTCNLEDIQADSFVDLNTTKNKLSLWAVKSNAEADLMEAVLALSSGKQTNRFFELMQIVWIDSRKLEETGIKIKDDEPGDTLIKDLAGTHRDAVDLTHSSLGSIAKIILDAIHMKQRLSVNMSKIERYMQTALRENRIDPNDFSVEAKKLKKRLEELKKEN